MYLFSNRVVRIWNMVLDNVVSALSVNVFNSFTADYEIASLKSEFKIILSILPLSDINTSETATRL